KRVCRARGRGIQGRLTTAGQCDTESRKCARELNGGRPRAGQRKPHAILVSFLVDAGSPSLGRWAKLGAGWLIEEREHGRGLPKVEQADAVGAHVELLRVAARVLRLEVVGLVADCHREQRVVTRTELGVAVYDHATVLHTYRRTEVV